MGCVPRSVNQDLKQGVPVLLVPNLDEYCRWLLRWCWSNPASATVFAKVPKHKSLQNSLQRTMVWVMKSGGIPMSLSPTKIHQGKAAQTMQLALFSTWTNHTHSFEYCHVVLCFLGRFWLVTSKKTAGLCGKYESLHGILWSLAVSRPLWLGQLLRWLQTRVTVTSY